LKKKHKKVFSTR